MWAGFAVGTLGTLRVVKVDEARPVAHPRTAEAQVVGQTILNQPGSQNMKDSADTPVVFAIPASLLEQLRLRRARIRSKRPPMGSSDGERKYLSTADIVRSAGSPHDSTDLARAFVAGMNELQMQVEEQYDAFLLEMWAVSS
jgi:hypothetical protein